MALVTYGTIVTDVRGTLGGIIYSRAKSGPTVRTPSTKPWVDTPRRQQIRAILQACCTAWTTTLTQAQRDGWEWYASTLHTPGRMGRPIARAGFNAFVASYFWRYLAGPESYVSPPTTPGPGPALAVLEAWIWPGSAAIDMYLQPGHPALASAYGNVLADVSNPHPVTRTTFQGKMRLSASIYNGSYPPDPQPEFAITNPWGASGPAGQTYYWVTLKTLNPDNRMSPPTRVKIPVLSPP